MFLIYFIEELKISYLKSIMYNLYNLLVVILLFLNRTELNINEDFFNLHKFILDLILLILKIKLR